MYNGNGNGNMGGYGLFTDPHEAGAIKAIATAGKEIKDAYMRGNITDVEFSCLIEIAAIADITGDQKMKDYVEEYLLMGTSINGDSREKLTQVFTGGYVPNDKYIRRDNRHDKKRNEDREQERERA